MRKKFITDLIGPSAPSGDTGFSWNFSADFDGGTEKLELTSGGNIDVANAWTVLCWVKWATQSTTNSQIISINNAPANGNAITLNYTATGPFTGVNAAITDSANANFKLYVYGGLVLANGDPWRQLTMTWDGANLKLYNNGSLQTPSSIVLDQSITMTSTNRGVAIGDQVGGTGAAPFAGLYHSQAVWKSALTDTQILSSYNSGIRHTYDLSVLNTSDLTQWWVLGDTTVSLNKVAGGININTNSVGMTAADSSTDVP